MRKPKIKDFVHGIRNENSLSLQLRLNLIDEGFSPVPSELEEKYRTIVRDALKVRRANEMRSAA